MCLPGSVRTPLFLSGGGSSLHVLARFCPDPPLFVRWGVVLACACQVLSGPPSFCPVGGRPCMCLPGSVRTPLFLSGGGSSLHVLARFCPDPPLFVRWGVVLAALLFRKSIYLNILKPARLNFLSDHKRISIVLIFSLTFRIVHRYLSILVARSLGRVDVFCSMTLDLHNRRVLKSCVCVCFDFPGHVR